MKNQSLQIKKNKFLISSLIILTLFSILSIFVYYGETDKSNSNNPNNINNSNSSGLIVHLDFAPLKFFNSYHTPILNQIMQFLSDYGREYFWIVVLIIMFFFGGFDGKMTTLIIIVSFLVIIPVNILIKEMVNRNRPSSSTYNDFAGPSDNSYPSGHASIVSAGALISVAFYKNSLRQKFISSLLVVEALLVCISRLYLGLHYPFDIVGGILLGTGISLLLSNDILFYERILKIKLLSKR